MYRYATFLACAVTATSNLAPQITRFIDDTGVIRHGHLMYNGIEAELIDGDAFGTHELTGTYARIQKILSPIAHVPVIYAVGLNYPDHAHAVSNTSITSPIIFFKNRNAVLGPDEDVIIPQCSASPDYEAELGVIIKDTFKDATLENALDHVLGYTVVNDISGRCWQKGWADAYNTSTGTGGDFNVCVGDGGQWSFSKGFDTHLPFGPSLVPQRELGDASGLPIKMHLNGKVMQNDTTSNMIYGVREIIEFISRGTTIEAGTIIATGTMGGVGDLRVPRVVLQDGDNVTVTIGSIGALTNRIVVPKAGGPPPEPLIIDRVLPESSSRPAAAAGPLRLAQRILRFVDAAGKERYGEPIVSIRAEKGGSGAASVAAHYTAAVGSEVELLVDGADGFNSRALSGRTATIAKLLAPVKDPPAVYGIGLNYADHTHASNLTLPLAPIVFFKNRKSIVGSGEEVVVPATSSMPDWEAEMAFVFGKTCKNVPAARALDCVLGYMVANDVSARCWQSDTVVNGTSGACLGNGGQWSYSKSFDTHCPLGPYLTHKDVVGGDANGLLLQMHLNGELMQNATTADMIFGVQELVEFITMGTTVEAGTIVVTGTPGGVGINRSPPLALKDGDVMEIAISGLGSIRNTVVRH